MLRNYLKVALRSLRKQKGYTFINILGLSTGLACFILILLFVQHEYSHNRFYENAERIHRVIQRIPGATYKGSEYVAMMPAPMAEALVRDFPEVEAATNIADFHALLSYNNNHFLETGLWVDAQFLNVFSIALHLGDRNTALQAPNSIVISSSLAKKIFKNTPPLGQSIEVEDTVSFTVTGIMADPPPNSSFAYDYLASFSSNPDYQFDLSNNRWNSNYIYTFFRTKTGTDLDQLQEKVNSMVDTYVYADREAAPGEMREEFLIQGLTDVHLRSQFNHDIGAMTGTEHKGSLVNLYLFLAIGIIILVLACVNYVNLAIARSLRRAREVGLRKAVGADKQQVIGQFLGESTTYCIVCPAHVDHIGSCLSSALLPACRSPTADELLREPVHHPWATPFTFSGWLFIGQLSGGIHGSTSAKTGIERSHQWSTFPGEASEGVGYCTVHCIHCLDYMRHGNLSAIAIRSEPRHWL